MTVKVLRAQDRKIVVIIDSVLVEKQFEEGNRQLDLTAEFYHGDEKSEEEIKQIVKNVYILYIVGKRSVALASEQGWINKGNIMVIKGIPHAEAMM